jgi:hypothetical protein
MEQKYYVYEWLREDGTPYYIGKGEGFRAYCKRPYRPLDKSRIRIIKDKLTEEEAFNLEIELIKKYGRQDLGTGILKNKTDGGEGASHSLETKAKISKVGKGRAAWNKGLSATTDKRVKRNAESRIGQVFSEEAKKNMSGYKISDEAKQRMSTGQKGKTYPKKVCPVCSREIATCTFNKHYATHKRAK